MKQDFQLNYYIFIFHNFSRKWTLFYYPFFIIMMMKEHNEGFCLSSKLSNAYIQYMLTKYLSFYEENFICVKRENILLDSFIYIKRNMLKFV